MSGKLIILSGFQKTFEKHKNNHLLVVAINKYVSNLLKDTLLRPPSQREIALWTNQIVSGSSRKSISLALLHSFERKNKLINNLFYKFIGKPDSSIIEKYYEKFDDNFERNTIKKILCSEIFLNRKKPEEFIDSIFLNILERFPLNWEKKIWIEKLTTENCFRENLISSLLSSPQYFRQFIAKTYYDLIGTLPTLSISQFLTRKFESGSSNEEIIAEITASDEYFKKAMLK